MRIIIAAGGTGGHIIPAIAVAEAIKEQNPAAEITFVGIGKPIEEKLLHEAGFRLTVVPFVPLLGSGVGGIFKMILRFPSAFYKSFKLLKHTRPDLLIGFGGFPSFVPFITATLFNIPRILHEQNVQVGVANKILSLFASKVFGVTGANGFLRAKDLQLLPNPVRKSFFSIPDWQMKAHGSPLTVLIVGGSQGAVAVNTAVLSLSDFFDRHNIRVIHQTGERDLERVRAGYIERGFKNVELLPFINNIHEAYARADLIICRAGAMTVAEVSAAGRAAIFIPLPIAGGHQAENVAALCKEGGAICLEQDDKLIVVLRKTMQQLISHPEMLQHMASVARSQSLTGGEPSATVVAKCALELAKRG